MHEARYNLSKYIDHKGSCQMGKTWKANGKDMRKHARNGHSR
ncbi:hypothetical protein HanPI659440_Chr13g0505371 [Helianthus annuus]|nr:hypothetical protein HanPI659440_Chr13g0505371 [Helianthus annuus]